MKVNILGSCISRVAMLNGDTAAHGITDDNIELDYFLDKQNIVLAMMTPPFTREEVESIQKEEIYDESRIHSLKQCLNKETIELLLNSDAEWLIMDLYDMQADFATYNETAFSTCAHEFFQTGLYRKYADQIGIGNLMNIPKPLWYSYIDLFFGCVMEKYDSDHIILNCFRSNTYYLAKDGRIKEIPEEFKKPYHSNDKYNKQLYDVEEYIINRYYPYVIDLSKYYMGDENAWDNLNGAHFEKAFYRETFAQIKRIINGESKEKYYAQPHFFDQKGNETEEDTKRKFDIEQGIKMLEELISKDDILWMNILNKLNTYAPQDERVKEYVVCLNNILNS